MKPGGGSTSASVHGAVVKYGSSAGHGFSAGETQSWTLDSPDTPTWAYPVTGTGSSGFTGLGTVDEQTPLTGTELAWRLARPAWGYGYATEAARAALRYGFDAMGLSEVVAVTMAH